MGVRLDDSSVTSATPGVLVKGEVDPTLTALALNVVSGTNSSRRVSDQIDTSYLVSGATAYWTGLQLLTDGGMTLSLAATATESGISSGPQLTESAEDSIYIVLFYGNESAVWEFSHLDESDETERYVFSSTSVSAAGPENNSALRSAINDDSSVIVMLVDGSHANINIDALATSTVGVEIRLDSLSELETVFDRASTETNAGAWVERISGSTPSGSTGPGTNSSGPYVFSEATDDEGFNMEAGGGRLTTILNRSTLTVKSDVMAEWDGVRRTVDFRANIAGEWGDVSGQDEGFDIEGRASSSDTWTRIEIVEGWDYSATGYMSGGTVTDAAGDTQTFAQDGGWVDFSVAIPDGYTQIRFRNRVAHTGDNPYKHDIALWSITLQPGIVLSDTVRLNSIAQLDSIFDRATTGVTDGGWTDVIPSDGSTPTGSTGPGNGSDTPYVFAEASSSDNSQTITERINLIHANSVLAVKSDIMDASTLR